MWIDPVFRELGKRYYQQAEDPESRTEKYDDIFRDRDDVQYGQFPDGSEESVCGNSTERAKHWPESLMSRSSQRWKFEKNSNQRPVLSMSLIVNDSILFLRRLR